MDRPLHRGAAGGTTMLKEQFVAVGSALLISFAVWSAPRAVNAQGFSLNVGEAAGVGIAIGGVVALAPLGLGIADLVSYGLDSPWDDGWAVVDLVVGGLTLGAGAVFMSVAAGANDGGEGWLAVGIPTAVWGGHLVGHGIWSLLNNDRPPPVSVSVSTDGASLGWSGSL
ncbi:MAG: hypothetical protein SFX73_17215 [Kofleriaceae bacterium]|nr:hypothetical protein [Kofleriaceae bacterium]